MIPPGVAPVKRLVLTGGRGFVIARSASEGFWLPQERVGPRQTSAGLVGTCCDQVVVAPAGRWGTKPTHRQTRPWMPGDGGRSPSRGVAPHFVTLRLNVQTLPSVETSSQPSRPRWFSSFTLCAAGLASLAAA